MTQPIESVIEESLAEEPTSRPQHLGNTLLKQPKLQALKSYNEATAVGGGAHVRTDGPPKQHDDKMARTMKTIRDKAGGFFDAKITNSGIAKDVSDEVLALGLHPLKVIHQATVAEVTPTREYTAINTAGGGFTSKNFNQKRQSDFLIDD